MSASHRDAAKSANNALAKTALRGFASGSPSQEDIKQLMKSTGRMADLAKKKRGKKVPQPDVRDSRISLLMRQLYVTMDHCELARAGGSQLTTITITRETLPCRTAFDKLSPIRLKDLRGETLHKGRCIVLRTISVPVQVSGLGLVAEDHSGQACMVYLFHINVGGDETNYIPQNTYFAIREPYYRFSQDPDLYVLRVDHPSDFMQLLPTDTLVRGSPWLEEEHRVKYVELDPRKLLEAGTVCLHDKKFEAAFVKFNTAIGNCPPTPGSELWWGLYYHRGQARLDLNQYEGALDDCRTVLSHDPKNRKALLLKATALYRIRRFDLSSTAFKDIHESDPNCEDAKKWFHMAAKRLEEQTFGGYNFKEMEKEAANSEFPRLDHADYTAAVEVKWSNVVRAERGLFAGRDIEQGGLVLCEKAMQLCYKDEISPKMVVNIVNGRYYEGPNAYLPSLVAQFLYDNPSFAPEFFKLHSTRNPGGKGFIPYTEDGHPFHDIFTIASILDTNTFNVEKMPDLIGDPGGEGSNEGGGDDEEKPSMGDDAGIWIQSSYINHSCLGNVSRAFIGDMVIFRAQRAIKKGEEILTPYVPPTTPLESRIEVLNMFGFICKCELCKSQKAASHGTLRRRRAALKKFDEIWYNKADYGIRLPDAVEREIRLALEKIQATYPKPEFCIELVKPYTQLFFKADLLYNAGETLTVLREVIRRVSGTDIGDLESFEPKLWFEALFTFMGFLQITLEEAGFDVRATRCRKIMKIMYGNLSGLGAEDTPVDQIIEIFKDRLVLRRLEYRAFN